MLVEKRIKLQISTLLISLLFFSSTRGWEKSSGCIRKGERKGRVLPHELWHKTIEILMNISFLIRFLRYYICHISHSWYIDFCTIILKCMFQRVLTMAWSVTEAIVCHFSSENQ